MKSTNFADWMLNTVKSIHYANREEMTKAFNSFRNPKLKLENYKFKNN